jgi:thiamine-phosphate pyrophosphorylase
MFLHKLKETLRFYFITDDGVAIPLLQQIKIAIRAGASVIQYRNKAFTLEFFDELLAIRDVCKCNFIPLIINDDILLAKAVTADGVHLGQEDEAPQAARHILGDQAIIGVSASNLDELQRTDVTHCNYIGTGPVFATQTKKDAKKVIGLSGLASVVHASPVPVVAIGGIDHTNAAACIDRGAAGVAVISHISRAEHPAKNARRTAAACGCSSRALLASTWSDEFTLIEKLLKNVPVGDTAVHPMVDIVGDDACLLHSLDHPVITTDTQKENVHFRLDWQTPEEIGGKAAEITFSDLAAAYASPVSLFVNLSLPTYVSDVTIEAIYKGIADALIKHHCLLGGGNVSGGHELSLDLFAVGRGWPDIFPMRSNARPKQGLYCTGPLGLAGAGLYCLLENDDDFQTLVAKFKSPTARFDAARILADNRVDCVIDISDGLVGDAGQIAKASNISVSFDLSGCPFDPALVSFCKKYGKTPHDMILAGGEDYELLFTCAPEIFHNIKRDLPEAFQVGRCHDYRGAHLMNSPVNISSFQHGKRQKTK